MILDALRTRIRAAAVSFGDRAMRVRRVEVESLARALATLLFVTRVLPGIHWPTRVRTYDSWGYASVAAPDYPNLLNISGAAPRPWPVPLFYTFFGDDEGRLLAQLLLSSLAWAILTFVVCSRLRHPLVAGAIGVLLGVLSFSGPARGWDAMILSESLTITLALALVIVLLRFLEAGALARGLAVGGVAGTLVTARPALLPVALALVVAALWRLRRAERGPIAAGLLVFTLFVTYLGVTHQAQQRAFQEFEREIHAVSVPSTQEQETWASLLYARYLPDREMADWLDAHGAPDPAPGMLAMEGPDNLRNWVSFRSAFLASQAWQQWYLESGGSRLFITLPLRTPMIHLRLFWRDLPFLLEASWGAPSYPSLRFPPPGSWVPFFRTVNGYPVDVAVLLSCCLAGVIRGIWRGRRVSVVGAVGLCTAFGASLAILSSWALVGSEMVRHSVPGPLMLRVGLVVLAGEVLDQMFGSRWRRAVADA